MTFLDFSASVISSLAWPACVLTIAYMFRTEFRDVLSRLTRLKYKDLDADFGSAVRELEEEAQKIDISPALPPAKAETPTIGTSDRLAEAERLLAEFPEPAVARAWQSVEDALLEVATRLGVVEGANVRSMSLSIIAALVSNGHMDQSTAELLGRMRKLRNLVVHGGGLPISSDEAREFVALARGITERLTETRK
ncbi:MAG: hypothetical protein WAW39_29300 [Prosthecobacter sp.]|uniref:hypothetical protein n=1 Tax=Prosthecobacter sp. TaxID=1965333 RepID=UPI003BB01054